MPNNFQHETPVVPPKWSGDERQYARQVDELIERLYVTLGQLKLRVKALEKAAENKTE